MDQQSEPAEARLAVQAGDQVVREANPLERRAEHELARMQDERRVLLHLDQLRQVFLLLADVDVWIPVVVEDPEVTVDADVDARRLQKRVVVRVDLDAPLGQKAGNRPI